MMRMAITFLAVASAVCATTLLSPNPASAHKTHMDVFNKKYGIEAAKEKKCYLCHGKSKKMCSDYALEIEKALGAKRVKDKVLIEKALEEVEKVEYEEGMTYGELLKSGKLPAPYSADSEE